MREEAQGCDGVDQRLRQHAAHEIEHQRESREQDDQTEKGRRHESDHLVAGRRRKTGADREETARHQEAAEVRRDDRAVIGTAEVVDRDPHREGERERDAGEAPGREKLAEHRLPQRHRQRQQQLDAAAVAFLRPDAHRDGRNEHQVEPRMPAEERLQIGLTALKQASELKREYRGQQQKEEDEDVSQRGREVALELAPENHQDLVQVCAPPSDPGAGVNAARSAAVGRVSVRNTSSRRPDSRCSSGTSQSCFTISALTGGSAFLPGRGTAVSRRSRSSASTLATSASPAISRRAAWNSSVLSKRSVTAWW